MEKVLNNWLTIIPVVTKKIKDVISYFWQPSMGTNYSYRSINEQKTQKSHGGANINLSLETVMVLRVGSNGKYMVSIQAIHPGNPGERVLLSGGQSEMAVIERCLQDNLELERTSIINYMPSDYIEIYNEALSVGNYSCCLTMLRGVEAHINQITEERNRLLSHTMRNPK